MKTRISVIIPVYNADKYIKRCLDSLIGQTIGMENIQLIIVDDASNDSSLENVLEYERKYPENILIVSLKENGGQANARNIGMSYANSPYITFVDADDWVELDIYEKMLEPAEKYQCDVIQCQIVEEIEGAKAKYQEEVSAPGIYRTKSEQEKKEFFRIWKSPGVIGNTLYSTKLVLENQFQFRHFEKYEDNYWAGVFLYFFRSIYIMPEFLYHYRISEFSNSHERNDAAHFVRLEIEIEKLKYYSKKGLFDKYYEEIREQFLKGFYANTLHIICCKFDIFPLEKVQWMQSIVREIFPDYLVYCKESKLFINSVRTVSFDFSLDIWEEYKKAYLDWIGIGKKEKIIKFYMAMRSVLDL